MELRSKKLTEDIKQPKPSQDKSAQKLNTAKTKFSDENKSININKKLHSINTLTEKEIQKALKLNEERYKLKIN